MPTAEELLALETEAAANIMDVMMGGNRSWRERVDFADTLGSTFLESADWQQALTYARAALRSIASDLPTMLAEERVAGREEAANLVQCIAYAHRTGKYQNVEAARELENAVFVIRNFSGEAVR